MERIKLNQMNKKSIFLAIGLLAILAIGSIILYLSFLQNQSSSGVVSENTESGKIDETSDSIDAKQTPFSELEKTDFEIDSNLRTVEGIKDNILNYIFGDEEFRNENFYSLMSDTINLALINKYDINAFVPRFDLAKKIDVTNYERNFIEINYTVKETNSTNFKFRCTQVLNVYLIANICKDSNDRINLEKMPFIL